MEVKASWPEENYYKLEENLVQLSYWIVYNGRKLAIDEILGKCVDCFDYTFAFKEEMERKFPGSTIEIVYEEAGSKLDSS